MKRAATIILILGIAVGVLLAGCGKKTAEPETVRFEPQTGAKIEIITQETASEAVSVTAPTTKAVATTAKATTTAAATTAVTTTAPTTRPATTAPVTQAPTTQKPTQAPTTAAPTAYRSADGNFDAKDANVILAGRLVRVGDRWTDVDLGSYSRKESVPSCHGAGNDYIYHFDGFDVYTYMNGSVETVYEIDLIGAKYATPKGVAAGSGEQEVLTRYGIDANERNDYFISYQDGAYRLDFQLEGGVVTQIVMSIES